MNRTDQQRRQTENGDRPELAESIAADLSDRSFSRGCLAGHPHTGAFFYPEAPRLICERWPTLCRVSKSPVPAPVIPPATAAPPPVADNADGRVIRMARSKRGAAVFTRPDPVSRSQAEVSRSQERDGATAHDHSLIPDSVSGYFMILLEWAESESVSRRDDQEQGE